MPSFVKTKEDERLWAKAKGIAEESGHKEDWAYITGIFKKMKGGKVAVKPDYEFKSGPEAKKAQTDPAEELAIRALLAEDAENEKKWARRLERLAERRPDLVESGFLRLARSNAKVVEVPNTFSPVVLEPAKATRKEHPFEGFIDFQGIKIDVENAKGSTRSGKGPEGEWSTYMFAHYGEIRGTEGTDGDKLDVYVGDNHDSSLVVVIHQHNPWDGAYDEDKVVLGCESVEEAIGLYKKQYDRPGFFKDGEYTAMPIGAFWRWVNEEKNRGKKVKVANRRVAVTWVSVPRLDGSVLRDAQMVKWVRITSSGQMGETVARRMPNGWNVQYLRSGQTYDPKAPIKGRPKKDADIVKLYQEQGGSAPHIIKGAPAAAPAATNPLPEAQRHWAVFMDGLRKFIGDDPRIENLKWTGGPVMIKPKGQEWLGITANLDTDSRYGVVLTLMSKGGRQAYQFPTQAMRFPSIEHFLGDIVVRYAVKHAPAAPTSAPSKAAPQITTSEVTSFLRSMTTRIGGRNRDVDYYPPGHDGFHSPFWSVEPSNRQRLDHYVGSFDFRDEDDEMYDPEGWNEEAWEEEYAGPLHAEVKKKLDDRFGKGLFTVDIGEKGHIDVQATPAGQAALGIGKAARELSQYMVPGRAVKNLNVPLNDLLLLGPGRGTYGIPESDVNKIAIVDKWAKAVYQTVEEAITEAQTKGNHKKPNIDLKGLLGKIRSIIRDMDSLEGQKYMAQYEKDLKGIQHAIDNWDDLFIKPKGWEFWKKGDMAHHPVVPGAASRNLEQGLKGLDGLDLGPNRFTTKFSDRDIFANRAVYQATQDALARFYEESKKGITKPTGFKKALQMALNAYRDAETPEAKAYFKQYVDSLKLLQKVADHYNDLFEAPKMWEFWKKGYTEGQPGAINAAKVTLTNVLAYLRAIQWNYLASHWQSEGVASYGDHLLFQRLYEKIDDEIDSLAEKLVGLFGSAVVNGAEQAKLMAFAMYELSQIGDPFERGLKSEQVFQQMLKKSIAALEDLGQLSLGLDDMLRTLANDHETAIYLIQQRQRGRVASRSRRMVAGVATRTVLRNAAKVLWSYSFQDHKDPNQVVIPPGSRFDPKAYKKLVDQFKNWNDKRIKYLRHSPDDGDKFQQAVAEQRKLQVQIERMENMLPIEERPKLYHQFWKDPFWKKPFREFKYAALAGTDTASFYVIAPEQLFHIANDGGWQDLAHHLWEVGDGDVETLWADMGDIIRRHGGAVITTGGDGAWDIGVKDDVSGQVEERGYLPPYGTADYAEFIEKNAQEVIHRLRQGGQ